VVCKTRQDNGRVEKTQPSVHFPYQNLRLYPASGGGGGGGHLTEDFNEEVWRNTTSYTRRKNDDFLHEQFLFVLLQLHSQKTQQVQESAFFLSPLILMLCDPENEKSVFSKHVCSFARDKKVVRVIT
jgi:hypothetical protein